MEINAGRGVEAQNPQSGGVSIDAAEQADFEERAAILEYDAGFSRAEAEARAAEEFPKPPAFLDRRNVYEGDATARHRGEAGGWGRVMSKKKPAPRSEKALRFVGNPEALKPILKQLGGSQADDWNNILTNQALNSLWLAHASDENSRSPV